MTHGHEVISAFLDDEPFDAAELAAALSEPTGRAVLIDLVALRSVVRTDSRMPTFSASSSRFGRTTRLAAAAAALILAIAGGYAAGTSQAEDAIEAPAPTRVVQAAPYVPAGGVR